MPVTPPTTIAARDDLKSVRLPRAVTMMEAMLALVRTDHELRQ
jgi:hypothetical protein